MATFVDICRGVELYTAPFLANAYPRSLIKRFYIFLTPFMVGNNSICVRRIFFSCPALIGHGFTHDWGKVNRYNASIYPPNLPKDVYEEMISLPLYSPPSPSLGLKTKKRFSAHRWSYDWGFSVWSHIASSVQYYRNWVTDVLGFIRVFGINIWVYLEECSIQRDRYLCFL